MPHHFTTTALLSAAILLAVSPQSALATRSSKRGLVFTPNKDYPQDNAVWVQSGSDLTWYYNYQDIPSPAFANLAQSKFEFVPMMWGVGDNPDDDTFFKSIRRQINQGLKITHVLGFNEPDGPGQYGGSDIAPLKAARAWVANFEPLAALGVKLGMPACTGAPGGLPWLQQFAANCSQLVSSGGQTKNCTFDFLPVHWYDNFGGLASHIGEREATFPNTPIWVTEYAYAHQDLENTQKFYNESAEYLDRLESLERYSYFGAFRSATSNVGPNAPFLNNDGKLTDIGSWYLGFAATGITPSSGTGAKANSAVRGGERSVSLAMAAGVVGAVGSLLL